MIANDIYDREKEGNVLFKNEHESESVESPMPPLFRETLKPLGAAMGQ